MRCLAIAATLVLVPLGAGAGEQCPALLDRSFPSLQDESTHSLCGYRGKVLLVVNTASQCGFTHQYEGLEKLQQTYGGRGLVVLGFPSNDFGQQEPGDRQQIAEFCRTAYGIKFPMFDKTVVRGASANPLFADLARLSGEAPRWNFHKYLIDRSGVRVDSFGSAVDPLDPVLLRAIESRLSQAL